MEKAIIANSHSFAPKILYPIPVARFFEQLDIRSLDNLSDFAKRSLTHVFLINSVFNNVDNIFGKYWSHSC